MRKPGQRETFDVMHSRGGCGRSSAISRKISWNICRAMGPKASRGTSRIANSSAARAAQRQQRQVKQLEDEGDLGHLEDNIADVGPPTQSEGVRLNARENGQIDQAFGLTEVLVAVSTSRLSCKRAGREH